MTEAQIERRVERYVDRADEAYLAGRMSEARYDRRMRAINRWADRLVRRAVYAIAWGS